MKIYKLSIFIFRRDLRLHDNTGLKKAMELSENVMPIFFLDPRLLENNPRRPSNAIQFMYESLQELNKELVKRGSGLHIIKGKPEEKISGIIEKYQIEGVFLNADYTPFSRKRDNSIKNVCHKNKVEFFSFSDALLHAPESIHKPNNTPYTVFTPFFNNAKTFPVRIPQINNYRNFINASDNNMENYLKDYVENKNIHQHGGRKNALLILKNINKLKNYKIIRDIPSIDGTTGLSPHNKFGTISIREVYKAVVDNLGESHSLVRELYWRDFFTYIVFHFPHALSGPFYKKYNSVTWSSDKKLFNLWRNGMTGFPIVDAGMRQLNATGFMHNRVRMITASFLVKDLHMDWKIGERYFAQKLIDYDPSVNNGNWQWVASTGCDAVPYFRIFNPWIQQKKFDPECLYIKKWVKELEYIPSKKIHSNVSDLSLFGYPKPIVDHSRESLIAKNIYKSI